MLAFNFSSIYSFPYTNHRGENEMRHVVALGLDYGTNMYYPKPQWLLRTFDLDRKDYRSFSLDKIDPATVRLGFIRD